MIRFIINEKEVATNLPSGTVILDFIRYHQNLLGTKIGCREGDCGACTILVGELHEGTLRYRSMTSCLMPIGNARGKHIVTIEGINFSDELNPIQKAMADEGATQCGFCTPGFVMSLAGFCLADQEPSVANAIAAVDGNICRCTGYKSIERAAGKIAAMMEERNGEEPPLFVSNQNILPPYFAEIKNRLRQLHEMERAGELTDLASLPERPRLVGGGTDLYVQKHDEMTNAPGQFMLDQPQLNGISKEGNRFTIGASVTVSDLQNSEFFNQAFPAFHRHAKLVSSTPIRNMATVAGNFINASPIGDFTIFFLALDAHLELRGEDTVRSNGKGIRTLPLRKLYKGYKQLEIKPGEHVEKIWFEVPVGDNHFNFEKISKRTHLDIASVNSAIHIIMKGDVIEQAGISAGGVAATPLYLQMASDFLKNKKINAEVVNEVIEIARQEISPISDARGSKEYKTILLGQLIRAHFISLFPKIEMEAWA